MQQNRRTKKREACVELKRVVPLAIRNCWEAANRYRCSLSSQVSVGSGLRLQEGLETKQRESFRTSTDRRQAELWSHNILLWLDTRNFLGHSLPFLVIRRCGSSSSLLTPSVKFLASVARLPRLETCLLLFFSFTRELEQGEGGGFAYRCKCTTTMLSIYFSSCDYTRA